MTEFLKFQGVENNHQKVMQYLCIFLFPNWGYLLSLVCLFIRFGRNLVPRPGIKPEPQQWRHWVLTTGPPGDSRYLLVLINLMYYYNSSS